ncbi:MAG: crossover junction endodeoxyribonuclease RuvC [Zoogloeaceae bacterium]|jgi:crossover junction endodeoxyribonuclease RuvC|nr:crossover junction endodeoxyribonuclease RuvC [Zoogloeaceae bacterium]
MIVSRILGIDPGLNATGFGLVEKRGQQLLYLASGCVRSNPKEALPERIATIFSGVREVIARHNPDEAAIEKVFVNVNPQSTLLLGQARGAAIAALMAGGLPLAEYSALQIKQAVVGHGKAAKEQVQHMVARLLRLSAPPRADAADALACAICHAHHAANPALSEVREQHFAQNPRRLVRALKVRAGRLQDDVES